MLLKGGLSHMRNRGNSKSENLNSKQIQMTEAKNSKQYDLKVK